MPHQAPLQAGDPRRVGRYRLAGRIAGIPSDGPIYLGSGPDGSEVAISMLLGDWATDGAARDRFAAEAAVAKRVPPFCAARVLDSGVDGNDAYLVSEYVPGRSLLEIISADGVLDGAEVEAAAIGMATGLASIHHAGLVHGNFGPEYVIMTNAGPRVVEFGITPPYGMATPSADMLAWAQTVVFVATGRPPTTMADLAVLPHHLRDLVADCLGPDPSGRPAARAAVVELIGREDVPAGVLAEGSRRAMPLAGPGPRRGQAAELGYAAAAAPPAASSAAPPTGQRPLAGTGYRTGYGTSSRPAAGAGPRPASGTPPGTGPRPASRHSRTPESEARLPSGDRPGRPPERSGRGMRTTLIVAGAAVACAVIIVVIAHLGGGGSGKPQAGSGRSTTPAATSPVTKVSTPPALLIPAGFIGNWSGQVHQPPNDTYTVTVDFDKGSSSGTVTYTTVGVSACSPSLSLTKVTGQTLTLSESGSGTCSPGTVTMKMIGTGTISYSFTGGGLSATGTLRKS